MIKHNIYYQTIPGKMNGIDPTSEELKTKWINVKGRVEHESILRDSAKMHELGLDPVYEKMVYLKRWGSWLNGCANYTGEI